MFITETLRGTANTTEKVMKMLEQHTQLRNISISKKRAALENFLKTNENKNGEMSTDAIIGSYGSATGGNVFGIQQRNKQTNKKLHANAEVLFLNLGDLEVLEKLNEAKKAKQLYFSYGQWAKGWLEPVGNGAYKIVWDSDIVQDYYAAGDSGTDNIVTIANGTFTFMQPQNDTLGPLAKFQFGFEFDKLAATPWSSDSCGPEANSKIN